MMNQFQRYKLFVIFNFITLIVEPINSFSLNSFNGDEVSNFTLLNDAQIVGTTEGNFVNLTNSAEFSSGQIIYKKPFNFIDSKSSKFVSFSSEFSFSITPGNDGDGLIFMIFPKDLDFSDVFDEGYFGVSKKVDHNFVGVEFDTRKAHVGIDVGSVVSSEILTLVGLVLNTGVTLRSWIDYESSSKRLEVRLAEDGSERPYNPLVSYGVDLSKMWDGKDVLVGFSSSSGNSSQISSLLSWKFEIRTVPSSMHSEPLNPEIGLGGDRHVRRKNCFLTVLGVVIFATGCGTLVAFLGLFAWVIFFGRHSNVVPELPMNAVDFKYEKVNVTVDNVADDSTRSSATC